MGSTAQNPEGIQSIDNLVKSLAVTNEKIDHMIKRTADHHSWAQETLGDNGAMLIGYVIFFIILQGIMLCFYSYWRARSDQRSKKFI